MKQFTKITGRFLGKFVGKWILKIPLHLAYVDTTLSVKNFKKSVKISQGYKQERGCLVHYLPLSQLWS